MGKKLLCLIMAICFVLGLTACGGESIAMDNSAKTDATLRGGFVAETADYVYFINGVESYTTDYKTGKVTKAALMRTKKSNFASLETAEYETVVSKLIVADDTDAGIYINGDYVYYAVPSNENDRTGTVKKDKLNFFRTKLDGTHTSKNIPGRDFTHAAKYRYIVSGENVYLVVYETDLYVYNADELELIYTTEADEDAKKVDKIDVAEVLFGDKSVYFTSLPVNKNLSDEENIQKDSFHHVYKIDFAGKKADLVINGEGKKGVAGENDNGVGLLGVTVDLLRVAGDKLYFAYTGLNTNANASPVYVEVAESALNADSANGWDKNSAFVELALTNKNTAGIFADTSIFYNGLIYYVNSTFGLLSYDNTKASDAETDFGVSVLYHSDVMVGATLDFINKEGSADVLYFHDSTGNYYKLNLTDLNADSKELKLNAIAIDTSWYSPEVVAVGGDYYFIAVYSDAEYDSYCYAINVTELEKAYNALEEDEDKTAFYELADEDEEEDESAEKVVRATDFAQRLGVLSAEDMPEEESAE